MYGIRYCLTEPSPLSSPVPRPGGRFSVTAANAISLEELPELDVSSSRFEVEPWAVARELESPEGLARSPRGLEVFGYDSCRRVLSDSRLEAGVDLIYEASGIVDGPLREHVLRQLANLEGDLHAAVRGAVGRYFTRQRVEAMRPLVRDLAGRFASECESSRGCDFSNDIAARLPSSLICHIVGVPLEDAPLLKDWSEKMMAVFVQDPSLGSGIAETYTELERYVEDLMDERRACPRDDLTSHLLDEARTGTITDADVFHSCMSVIRAGTDTTQSQMTLSLSVLLEHPEVWETIRDDPTKMPTIVSETIRYRTGTWTHQRVARDGADLFGIELEPGAIVHASVMVGHRDSTVFSHPDVFDINRDDLRRTLNWGLGRHFCIGQSMAALEIEETLGVVAARWRDLRQVGPLVTRGRPYQNIAVSLPLEFETAA
jgi:cytochrome P450